MRSATVGTLLISLLVNSGCLAATASREEPTNGPTVVLLHGLARTTSSMQRMESALQEGSEVVDAIGDWRLFGAVSGPAGGELGTATDSLPRRLGPVPFEAGIIAGSSSINWINSAIIPGEDDGKVSIESAKVEGMRDFLLVATSHPFLMADDGVIDQTLRFLTSGCFAHEAQETSVPGTQQCVPLDAPP